MDGMVQYSVSRRASSPSSVKMSQTHQAVQVVQNLSSSTVHLQSPQPIPQVARARSASAAGPRRVARSPDGRSVVTIESCSTRIPPAPSRTQSDCRNAVVRDHSVCSLDASTRAPSRQLSARRHASQQVPLGQRAFGASVQVLPAHSTQRSPDLGDSSGDLTPSELLSAVPSVNVGASLDLKCAEERITKLEMSLEERMTKIAADSMSGNLILCKSMEDRLTQKLETLRKDLQQEFSHKDFALPQDVVSLRNGIMNDLQKSVSLEFSNLRLELQGSVAKEEQGCSDGARPPIPSPLLAGVVDAVSERVLEQVREDQGCRQASEQYEQLKDLIKDLRSLPEKVGMGIAGDGQKAQAGSDNLHNLASMHNLVNNLVQICQSLANELDTERQQRNSNFAETLHRLGSIERKMSSDVATIPSVAHSRARSPSSAPFVAPIPQAAPADNFLERVMRSLEPHIIDDTSKLVKPTGQSSEWSTEVKSLRSRLENILLIGDTGASGIEHS